MLRVRLGPRHDCLAPGALEVLLSTTWRVGTDSDRVGARLVGPALGRADRGELPPEGVVAGALQVPPSGNPVLFLADHPTTGGYPVVAVVVDDDLGPAGQLAGGYPLRLRAVGSAQRRDR